MFTGIPMIVEALKKINDSKTKWRKPLSYKDLRRGRGRKFDVNPYATMTYDKSKIFYFVVDF